MASIYRTNVIIVLSFLYVYARHDHAQQEVAVLEELFETRWNLTSFSHIHNVYIRHWDELLVTIDKPTHIIIEKNFKKSIEINVTENWLITMTFHNVSYAINGTYTCTTGFKSKQDIVIHKEISVTEINISEHSENGCRKVICSSTHNVELFERDNGKINSNSCLSTDNGGIIVCCLKDKFMSVTNNCKSINSMYDQKNSLPNRNDNMRIAETQYSSATVPQSDVIIVQCSLLIFVSVCFFL